MYRGKGDGELRVHTLGPPYWMKPPRALPAVAEPQRKNPKIFALA